MHSVDMHAKTPCRVINCHPSLEWDDSYVLSLNVASLLHSVANPTTHCTLQILGKENVGKTSLLRQLVTDPHIKDNEGPDNLARFSMEITDGEWHSLKNAEESVKTPSIVLDIVDFSRHELYRPMHHCFMSKQAVFVVVFSLKEMCEYLSCTVTSQVNPLKDICYWLQSIHFQISGSEQIKRVLLVGTHREELPNPTESLKKIVAFLRSNLMGSIAHESYASHIQIVKLHKYFIPVESSFDFHAKGELYLKKSGTYLVQGAITNMCRSLQSSVECHKWLKFEEQLKKYSPSRKSPIMNMKEVEVIARISGISDSDKRHALKFLHDTGKIICMGK